MAHSEKRSYTVHRWGASIVGVMYFFVVQNVRPLKKREAVYQAILKGQKEQWKEERKGSKSSIHEKGTEKEAASGGVGRYCASDRGAGERDANGCVALNCGCAQAVTLFLLAPSHLLHCVRSCTAH